MCVCSCLGACVYVYLCVCGWVGVREKPALWFTHHHSLCPAEILTFSGTIAFCLSAELFEIQLFTHMYFFFSWGNQSDWCHFSGNSIKEKPMKWKCHILSCFCKGWTGFKNSKHSVWLLDKTLWALTKWLQKMLRSDFNFLQKKKLHPGLSSA